MAEHGRLAGVLRGIALTAALCLGAILVVSAADPPGAGAP